MSASPLEPERWDSRLIHALLEATPAGLEATRVAQAAERVDLLVTDIILPDMLGTEVAVAVRQAHPQAGLLFVSGHTEHHMFARWPAPRQSTVLQKPFAPIVFAQTMRQVLDDPEMDSPLGRAEH